MISVIIEVVVVLPWVPATPRPRRAATMPASASARDSTGIPACSAARTSTFVARHRGADARPRRRRAGTFSAACGTRHSTPEQAQPLEPRVLVEVRAADPVTHLGQDRRVRAHARAADADDVDPPRRAEVQHGTGLRRGHGPPPPPDRRAVRRHRGGRAERAASDISVSRVGIEQQLAGRPRRAARRRTASSGTQDRGAGPPP